jgi:hypothetical protein
MHFASWRKSSLKVKFWMVLDELIHVIPGVGNRRVAKSICDRFDLSLGVTRGELHRGRFYEEDEPLNKIKAAFERGEKGCTAPPANQNPTFDFPWPLDSPWRSDAGNTTTAGTVTNVTWTPPKTG